MLQGVGPTISKISPNINMTMLAIAKNLVKSLIEFCSYNIVVFTIKLIRITALIIREIIPTNIDPFRELQYEGQN